jgi:hypothetical protein
MRDAALESGRDASLASEMRDAALETGRDADLAVLGAPQALLLAKFGV